MTPQPILPTSTPIVMTLTVISDLRDTAEARQTLLKWLPTWSPFGKTQKADWLKSGVPFKPFGVWQMAELKSGDWYDQGFRGFTIASVWDVPKGETWIDEDIISQSEAFAHWIGNTFNLTVRLDVGDEQSGTHQAFGIHATTGADIRVTYNQIQEKMSHLIGVLFYAGMEDEKQQIFRMLNELSTIPGLSELVKKVEPQNSQTQPADPK